MPSKNPMPYSIKLTKDDVKTFEWVGVRYGWSDAFLALYPNKFQGLPKSGKNEFAEHEMWEWKEAVDGDMEGGHSIFPLLDPDSELWDKLFKLYESIV